MAGALLLVVAAGAPAQQQPPPTPPVGPVRPAPDTVPRAPAVEGAPAGAAPSSAPPWERSMPPDSLAAGGIQVHFWPEQERLARDLLAGAAAMPPLPALPPLTASAETPVRVLLAPGPEAFAALTGGRVPEWGAGVAFPDAGVVVLPAYASARGPTHGLARVLRHELAHVALRRWLSPVRPPRWFDEGYARWAAGEWDADAAWKLRIAFAMGRAPSLDSLTLGWPRGEVDAQVAYLLAATTVGYLVERGGERVLRIFLERWRDTGSLDEALRGTYGLTRSQFEEDWRREVRSDYGWAVFLSHSMVFWLAATLLFLVLFAVRRRRDKERLVRLRETEPPDRPAYWSGEEEEPPIPEDEGPGPTLGTGLR